MIIDAADEPDLVVARRQVRDGIERNPAFPGRLCPESDGDRHGLSPLLHERSRLRVQPEDGVHLPDPAAALAKLGCHLVITREAEGFSDVLEPNGSVDRTEGGSR